MNIKEAKEEIKRTFRAYQELPQDSPCRIPRNKQRPILLMGPPGIGKTAIMEQIASEYGIGLVSYAMTHHTRQSAIGLPFIRQTTFEGRKFSVTEYTMSEIIASVYQYMQRTKKTKGILFIDEINCVSETLSPVILQFLQEKTFGTHPVPEGWIIAAAGNPPEYNRSVREFDTATLDRVKYMEVEADFPVWKEYAVRKGIHPSILSYLSIHPDRFCRYRLDAEDPSFVTARGWEDLSCMLLALECLGEPVNGELFSQYLRHEETAREFALYYRLFCKYQRTLSLEDYLSGSMEENDAKGLSKRLRDAPFDERLAAASLIYECLRTLFAEYREKQSRGSALDALFLPVKEQAMDRDAFARYLDRKKEALDIRRKNGLLSIPDAEEEKALLFSLEEVLCEMKAGGYTHAAEAEAIYTQAQKPRKEALGVLGDRISLETEKGYRLLEVFLPDETAILYLTADLSKNPDAVAFFLRFPSKAYSRWSEKLLLTDREDALRRSIEKLQ